MRIGTLRHRITIQNKTTIKDTVGQEKETWVDLATVWASIEPLKGREYFAAHAVNAENTIKIRIRYYPGLKPTHRIKYGTRIFDIQSVINVDERNIEMILMCVEVL